MPRCEKKFSALLEAEQLPYYLPLVKSVRRYGRQTKRFTKPLFPGYVFVDFVGPEKARLYQQDLLVRVIPVDDQRRLVRQLDEIRHVLASGYELSLHPRLEKGGRVRVVAGPLLGLEGQIDDPAHPKGVVIVVDVLGQGVLVKIPVEDLKPIS
jgi:transcription antitermination factor NusG